MDTATASSTSRYPVSARVFTMRLRRLDTTVLAYMPAYHSLLCKCVEAGCDCLFDREEGLALEAAYEEIQTMYLQLVREVGVAQAEVTRASDVVVTVEEYGCSDSKIVASLDEKSVGLQKYSVFSGLLNMCREVLAFGICCIACLVDLVRRGSRMETQQIPKGQQEATPETAHLRAAESYAVVIDSLARDAQMIMKTFIPWCDGEQKWYTLMMEKRIDEDVVGIKDGGSRASCPHCGGLELSDLV